MESSGFENVVLDVSGDTLKVQFEHRVTHALSSAFAELSAATRARTSGCLEVLAVIHHRGIPLTTVLLSSSESGYRVVTATHNVSDIADRSVSLSGTAHARGEARTLDLVIHPYYRAHYGYYGAPWKPQFALAPRLSVQLWHGSEVSGQILLPLWNELSEEGDHVRPGLITLAQFIRLPGPIFARGAVGTFTNRRIGTDIQVRAPRHDDLVSFGVDAGWTTSVFYPNGSAFFEDDGRFLALGNVSFFIPRYALTIRAEGGRYLRDLGVRVDLVRQFGSIDVRFFAARSNLGQNAGLAITLPLAGGQFVRLQSLRLRPAPAGTFNYSYVHEAGVAVSYKTGHDLDDILMRFRPEFLEHSATP